MALPEHFENIELGNFIVMPNHLHGIVTIVAGDPRRDVAADSRRDTAHRILVYRL